MTKLTEQQEKVLSHLSDVPINVMRLTIEYYGVQPGRYGYPNLGRGRGGGAMRASLGALERRGLAKRVQSGWVKV